MLGHLHRSGALFLSRMWLAALAALVVTAGVVALAERRELLITATKPGPAARRPVFGLGLVAVLAATVLAATVLVVALPAPALPVAAVGLVAVTVRGGQRRLAVRDAAGVLGLPVLARLFGIAVALGALGRLWAGPAVLLAHVGSWATAGIAAVAPCY